MMRLQLEKRTRVLINTDPQRRCYNGCHARSEWRWGPWEWLEWNVDPARVEARLEFWRDLSDYAARERGESGRSEYRVVKIEDTASLP